MSDLRDRLVAHDGHDLELVARAAANDLAASEAMAARALLGSCAVCARLATDLIAIAVATRAMGSASGLAAAPAPREFRLTEADAGRLRRRSVPGLGFLSGGLGGRARGLGGALATLGLVGILASAGLPALFGAAGGAASSELTGAPAKDLASQPPELGPAATDADTLSATDTTGRTTIEMGDDGANPQVVPAITAGASIIALATGLALLLIGRRGRRSGS